MKKLVAVINGESQVEFDRDKPLDPRNQDYLEKMDQRLEQGIPHGAGNVFSPTQQQKIQFVANQLIDAIKAGNEQLAAATLSWLATRLPDLQQVSADEKAEDITIQLIYDKPYIKAEPIHFMKLNS